MIEIILGMVFGVALFFGGLIFGLKIAKHEVVSTKVNDVPQDDKKEYIEELKSAVKSSILQKSTAQDDAEEAKAEKLKELLE